MKREELNERKRLLELQADHTRWFSQEEFDRLTELSNKMLGEQSPPAEGAEEILTSLIKSLGEPTKIHNHIYEIRPYTVEGKTEWWMFHKGVGSGEPLAQWLNKFATLHSRKMVEISEKK